MSVQHRHCEARCPLFIVRSSLITFFHLSIDPHLLTGLWVSSFISEFAQDKGAQGPRLDERGKPWGPHSHIHQGRGTKWAPAWAEGRASA